MPGTDHRGSEPAVTICVVMEEILHGDGVGSRQLRHKRQHGHGAFVELAFRPSLCVGKVSTCMGGCMYGWVALSVDTLHISGRRGGECGPPQRQCQDAHAKDIALVCVEV
eukprot:365322-Chlamydomonas_euryale.AAC.9